MGRSPGEGATEDHRSRLRGYAEGRYRMREDHRREGAADGRGVARVGHVQGRRQGYALIREERRRSSRDRGRGRRLRSSRPPGLRLGSRRRRPESREGSGRARLMIEGATDDELVAAAIVREWPPGSLANALVKALREARAEIA